MIDFLNESYLQEYPFIPGSSTFGSALPNSAVLDIDVVVGSTEPFPGEDLILSGIVADGTKVTFTFTYGDLDIPFVVPLETAWGSSIWNTQSVVGFIQVGDLSGIPNGSHAGTAIVEPSRVQSRYKREVRTISVYNKIGTLYTDGCNTYPAVLDPYVVEATNLTGDITISPGRWAEVTQLDDPAQIIVGPSTTEEEGGEPACGQDLTPKPDNWPDNEPKCNEVLNTINGISPSKDTKTFSISGSRGVSVIPDGDHTIDVVINTASIFKKLPEASLP